MDPAHNHFLRRQALSQPATPLVTSLSSGQSYYTLESLEGATSLPFLKSAPPASLPRRESFPFSSESDALSHLDAQTRALQAEREALDARARLLAAERGALLRNLPATLPDQRMSGVGLQAVDARPRVPLEGMLDPNIQGKSLTDNGRTFSHGIDALRGGPFPDIRSLSQGLGSRPGNPMQLDSVNISRVPPAVGGIPPGAAEHGRLSELLHSQERGSGLPFLPSSNPMRAWRDVGRVEAVDGVHGRLLSNGARDSAVVHSEANKIKQVEQSKGLSSHSKPLAAVSAAPKIKPAPEQSEGWCAVCKIDCNNSKVLNFHLSGKKHKAAAAEKQRGNAAQREGEAIIKQGVKVPATTTTTTTTTSQPDKKRGKDGGLSEGSESVKRLKASVPASANIGQQAKATKSNPATTSKAPSHLVCNICKISTTGTANLESHMKGKRHAARVKELANPGAAAV